MLRKTLAETMQRVARQFEIETRLKGILVESERPLVHQFVIEARMGGGRVIEAEHLLLALAAGSDSEAGKLLTGSGLDRHRLRSALRTERNQSLAVAGVSPSEETRADAAQRESALSLGTSAKTAFKRALLASRESRPRRSRLRGTDLLRGILLAELGTVPRALAVAGVDRAALLSQTGTVRSES